MGHVEFEAVSVTWKHGRGKELTVLAENATFFSKCDHFFHDCPWVALNIVLRDDGLDVNLYGLNQLNTFQDEKVFGLVNFHFGRGDLVNFLRRGYKSGPKHFGKDMTLLVCQLHNWTHTLEGFELQQINCNKSSLNCGLT